MLEGNLTEEVIKTGEEYTGGEIFPGKNSMHIYSVSELNLDIKKNLESSFSEIWVEGEVSNYYCHNNRHFYFDLKDESSKIRVVMFYESNKNLVFQIENGLHIIVSGYISLYEKRGEYQLVALSVRPAGKGELILAYEQLKARLESMGYFDANAKKKLPLLPGTIGVVTSTGGAVIKDMITVLSKRFENFHLIVKNVNVGGPTSQEEVCQAIDDLCSYGVDVIIIARGGGSLEDMWAFNTEMVADKVFKCSTPVISAIGHETDFTICDFVADVRAATPSVAAQVVILDKKEITDRINKIVSVLKKHIENRLLYCQKELESVTARKVFKKPLSLLLERWQELENNWKSLLSATAVSMEMKKSRLASIIAYIDAGRIKGKLKLHDSNIMKLRYILFSDINKNIEALKNRMSLLVKDLQSNSPVVVLEKGYAFLFKKGTRKAVKSIADIETGQEAEIILNDGILFAKILNKISKKFGIEV